MFLYSEILHDVFINDTMVSKLCKELCNIIEVYSICNKNITQDKLENYKNVRYLDLKNNKSVTCVENFPNLIVLKTSEIIENIANVPNLENLILRTPHITSCDNFPKLKRLELINTNIEDLSECKNLEVIHVINNRHQLDYSKIKNLKELIVEDKHQIVPCPHITILNTTHNFQSLDGFTNLQKLSLSNNDFIQTDDLNMCVFLEELNIHNCANIKMLNLPKLKILHVVDGKLENIDRCINLEYCKIDNCHQLSFNKFKNLKSLQYDDVRQEDIQDCINLEKLAFESNISVRNVRHLTKLKDLQCFGECIIGNDGIEGLDLEKLIIGDSNIRNCNKFANLKYLDCEGSRITQKDIENCKKLEELIFSDQEEIISCNCFPNLRRLKCGNITEQAIELCKDLEFCDITESQIRTMRSFPRLRILIAAFSNLERIVECPNIEHLHISNTNVKSVVGLPMLNHLSCSSSDIEGIKMCNKLETLYTNNYEFDISCFERLKNYF